MARKGASGILLVAAILLASWAAASPPSHVQGPDDATVADAYIYLLGRALVVRQEQMDRKAPNFAYNAIRYNPLGSADFVNPNFDVAYLEAWFAVDDRTPVILDVPEIHDRYYTAQILDEWGEVIVNINDRTFPSKPHGRFALVQPGWTGVLPADVSRIELHSSKAKMLARVELKGDPEGALALQHAFKAAPLGTPVIAPPPDLPMFDNKDLIGAEVFDAAETLIASALDVAPNAAQMQQKVRAVAAYVASGDDARAGVEAQLGTVIPPSRSMPSPGARPTATTGSVAARPATTARTTACAPSPISQASGRTRPTRWSTSWRPGTPTKPRSMAAAATR